MEVAVNYHVAFVIGADSIQDEFNHHAFGKAMVVCAGAPAKTAIAQLVNLLAPDEEKSKRIKTLGDKLMKIKEKRDELAHMLPSYESQTAVRLKRQSASRSVVWTSKAYSIGEMDAWVGKIQLRMTEIEQIIWAYTGWDRDRFEADQERWLQGLREKGVKA